MKDWNRQESKSVKAVCAVGAGCNKIYEKDRETCPFGFVGTGRGGVAGAVLLLWMGDSSQSATVQNDRCLAFVPHTQKLLPNFVILQNDKGKYYMILYIQHII